MDTNDVTCPCCGIPTLPRRGAGDECGLCGWRDYRSQNEHYPDRVVKGQNFAYCGFSLWAGVMVVPGKRGALVVEEGAPIWLMTAAAVSAAMFGVLSIVDHYDRRRNEHVYQRAVKASFVLMAAFMGLAIAVQLYLEDGFWGGVAGGIGALLIAGVVLARMMQEDRIEY